MTRWTAAVAVLAVATIAAIVSYSHIETLALVNGQTITAARLLPASVDGVVMVSSLVMLDAARKAVPAPALARVMLVIAILATLAANSAVGASHGVIGILVSGWPAVAFIGSAEVLLGMIRGRSGALTRTHGTVPWTVPGTAETADETTLMGVPEIALADEYTAAPRVPKADGPRTRPADQAPARDTGPGTPEALFPPASRARTPHAPEVLFSAEIEAGTLPSIRTIKRRMKVGQGRAVIVRDQLAALVTAPVSDPREIVEVGG